MMTVLISQYSRQVVLVALMLCITSPVVAQQTPYVLSERLGTSISAEDRAYFGLFPDRADFVSASVFEGSGSDIAIHITTRNRRVIETLSRAVATELGSYLDNYERYILENDFQSLNWLLIRHLVNPEVPYSEGQRVHVRLHNGLSHEGRLLYADEEHILLTQAPDMLSYADTAYVIAIRPHDIERMGARAEEIPQVRSLLATLFPPIPRAENTPVDPEQNAYEGSLLSKLREDMALEAARIPPEIQHLLRQREQETAITSDVAWSHEPTFASYRASRDRFHIFVPWIPVSLSPNTFGDVVFTGDRGTLQSPVSSKGSFLAPKLHVELEYAHEEKEHIRLGVNFQQHEQVPALPLDEGNSAATFSSEYLSGYALGVFAAFIPNPLHQNTRFKSIAPEYSLRLGVTFARLQTTSRMTIRNRVQQSKDRHTLIGVQTQAGLDLYFNRRFSLAVALQAQVYPIVRRKQQVASGYSTYNSYTYGYAAQRTYTAFQINLLTGLRVHL